MSMPSSKELYIMNGGNKLYIWKDGYQDVYDATPEEEAEWDKEIIANAYGQLGKERNAVNIKFAVNTLLLHRQDGVAKLLARRLADEEPVRQIAFANVLWNISRFKNSFQILLENLDKGGGKYRDEVFFALNDFAECKEARLFLLDCLEGGDVIRRKKAQTVVAMWAYSGMPVLRDRGLYEKIVSTDVAERSASLQQLRKIFTDDHKNIPGGSDL